MASMLGNIKIGSTAARFTLFNFFMLYMTNQINTRLNDPHSFIENFFQSEYSEEVISIRQIESTDDLPERIGRYVLTPEIIELNRARIGDQSRSYYLVIASENAYLIRTRLRNSKVLQEWNIFTPLNQRFQSYNDNLSDADRRIARAESLIAQNYISKNQREEFQGILGPVPELLNSAYSSIDEITESTDTFWPYGGPLTGKGIAERKYGGKGEGIVSRARRQLSTGLESTITEIYIPDALEEIEARQQSTGELIPGIQLALEFSDIIDQLGTNIQDKYGWMGHSFQRSSEEFDSLYSQAEAKLNDLGEFIKKINPRTELKENTKNGMIMLDAAMEAYDRKVSENQERLARRGS